MTALWLRPLIQSSAFGLIAKLDTQVFQEKKVIEYLIDC